MQYFLLIGAALNFIGAFKLAAESLSMPSNSEAEHVQLKLFVLGVAVTLGAMYIYLFFNVQYIYPFLVFGTGLKIWAFISCLYLLIVDRINYKLFFEFGLSNGVVAAMFTVLLVSHT